jgi:hypothetical protein
MLSKAILLAWLSCAIFLQTTTAQAPSNSRGEAITAFKKGEEVAPLDKLDKKYIKGLYNNYRQAQAAEDKQHAEQEFRLHRILGKEKDKVYYYVGWFSPLAPELPLLHGLMVFNKTYDSEQGGYMGVNYMIPNDEKYLLSWTKKEEVFEVEEIETWPINTCALRFREMSEQKGVVLDMIGLCNSDNPQSPFQHYNAYMIFNSDNIECKSSFFKTQEELLFVHDVVYDLLSRKNLSATPNKDIEE